MDAGKPPPNSPPFISRSQLWRELPAPAAVAALEAGFASRGDDWSEAPRMVAEHPRGELLLMPASGPEGAGAKVVTVVPANPAAGLPLINGVYVLFSPQTLVPELLIDGAALTELRTAAVSALAARHLASPASRRLLVFGAGAQARAHVLVLREILPIEEVTIVGAGPDSARAAGLVDELRATGLAARVGVPGDVSSADLVISATTSTSPVFDSSLLAAGTHVGAVGSYKPAASELDLALLRRALLVVETREAACREAGEIVGAIAAGALPRSGFGHELVELVRGEVTRSNPEQPSVFKSVGLPDEDLIVARALADRLRTPSNMR
jgi:ornithine cyclodeaminase/alanine dehydrogenase-like protein (mu-crystallin family)